MDKRYRVNNEIADKMNDIGTRLYVLKHCLNLFLFSFDSRFSDDKNIELFSIATVINSYFLETKKLYNEIESEFVI